MARIMPPEVSSGRDKPAISGHSSKLTAWMLLAGYTRSVREAPHPLRALPGALEGEP